MSGQGLGCLCSNHQEGDHVERQIFTGTVGWLHRAATCSPCRVEHSLYSSEGLVLSSHRLDTGSSMLSNLAMAPGALVLRSDQQMRPWKTSTPFVGHSAADRHHHGEWPRAPDASASGLHLSFPADEGSGASPSQSHESIGAKPRSRGLPQYGCLRTPAFHPVTSMSFCECLKLLSETALPDIPHEASSSLGTRLDQLGFQCSG